MASKRKIGDAEADVGAASGAPRPQFETRRAAFKASYEELNAHFARHVHARVAKQEAGGPVEDLEPLCRRSILCAQRLGLLPWALPGER